MPFDQFGRAQKSSMSRCLIEDSFAAPAEEQKRLRINLEGVN